MVGTGATVLAVLLVIVVFGCTMQRLSGMGLGLVAGPVVSLLLGPVEGILVVNVLAVVNAALITATTWRNIDLRKFLTVGSTMILGAVPGALVIRAISTDLLQVLVGGTLLVALAVVTFGLRWVPTPHGRFPALVAGAVGGFMNTLAGIAGPAITVYAQAARWDHRIYAATLQPLFVVGGALSVIIKLVTGAGSLGGSTRGSGRWDCSAWSSASRAARGCRRWCPRTGHTRWRSPWLPSAGWWCSCAAASDCSDRLRDTCGNP